MPDAPEAPKFDIPEPEAPSVDLLAVQETWGLRSTRWEWWLRVILKVALFVFVLALNVYWAHQVIMMVWKSGTPASGFYLGDTVLVALVTTSIANFIALVVIVAKHLFPSGS